MQFNAIIGNPPYQETKGGTKNVDVWQYFVFWAVGIADYTTLIHPARWLIPKKQMQTIHDKILKIGLASFDYYPNAMELFSNVLIDGGITITFFKSNYNGNIAYYNNGRYVGIYDDENTFLSNKFEDEIHSKLNPQDFGGKTMNDRIFGNVGSLGGGEYGYKKAEHLDKLRDNTNGMKEPIKIWANKGYGKGARFSWWFIDKSELNNIPEKLLKSRKVMIDKKGHPIIADNKVANIMNNIPEIVDKNVIASGDVLFVFPENDTDYELKLIKSMFLTKTIRFLMSITQKDLYVRGFENIPDYTYFIKDLNGKLFTDEFFYTKYNFSAELIKHINSCVSNKKSSLFLQTNC